MSEIEKKVNELVGDTAGCDHYGCRCWQAVADLKKIKDFCEEQIKKSIYEDLK